MNKFTFSFANLLLFLVLPFLVKAQNVDLTTSKDTLSVGEVFNYSIKILGEEQYDKIVFPDSTHFRNQAIEFISRERHKTSDYADSAKYKLQYFSNNDEIISPLPIRVITGNDTTTIFTPALTLHFKSVLADSSDESFAPIKPIFEFKSSFYKYLIFLLLIALLAFILYKYFGKKEEMVTEKKEIILPTFIDPLEELKKSLDSIKSRYPATSNRDFKLYYSDLSDSIRLYYQRTYNIPALESTTREVIRYIDAYAVSNEMVKETRQILLESDMVKFANITPTLDQSITIYDRALQFYELAKKHDTIRINRLKLQFYDKHSIDSATESQKTNEDEE